MPKKAVIGAMAHVLDAVIQLKDNFTDTIQRVEKSVGDFSRTYKRMGRDIQRTGRTISGIGKTLTASVTLPIVGVGVAATKSAIDFESAFAGVRKTVDATESQFTELEKGIRNMAKEIPATAEEIAGVAEAAGQLGIQTENILEFTRTMIDLGESTNLTADEAATSLARFANITQMSQNDFDRLGSTIVALGNNLATTEAEIVSMGMRLAGAGKQIGLSEAQIMSFAGALSSVGIEAEAGGSAFSKLMINMSLAAQNGTQMVKNYTVALESAGVSQKQVDIAMQKGGQSLDILAKKFGMSAKEFKEWQKDIDKNASALQDFANVAGMSATEFALAFEEDAAKALQAFVVGLQHTEDYGMTATQVLDQMGITEVRMRDALLRAAGASDVFTEALNLGAQAWDENTALTNEAAQRYETVASQIQIAKNKVKDLGIEIGQKLLPYVIQGIDKLSSFIETIQNMDDGTKETIKGVLKFAVTIGPLLLIIGKMTTGIGRLTLEFGFFADRVKDLGLIGAIFTPGVKVFLILSAIAAAVILLYKNFDKIKTKVSEVKTHFSGLKDVAKSLKDNLIGLKDKAVTKTKEKFEEFKDVLVDNQDAIKTTAAILGTIFGPALIKTGVQAAISGGKIASGFIANIAKAGVQAAINGTKVTVSFIASMVKAGVQATIAGGKIAIGFIGSLIKTAAQAVITAGTITGKLIVSLVSYAAQGWKTVASITATIGAWIAQKAVMVSSTVATKAMTVAQWALNTAMSANPIGIVIVLVAGLAAVLVILYKKCKPVRDAFNAMWGGIKHGAIVAANGIISAINFLIKGLNKIKIPKWVPKIGGKGVNIPLIPKLAKGTMDWQGGIVQVHEKGGEIIDLPRGSRVYPHDKSVQMAREQGRKESQTQTIVQRLIPVEIPNIKDQVQKVVQELKTVSIPNIKDITQTIKQRLIPVKVPNIDNQTQTIKQRLIPVKVPNIDNQTQTIIQKLIPANIKEPIPLEQPIKREIISIRNNNAKEREQKTRGNNKTEINIPKLADQIIVREESDIDKIAQSIAREIEKASLNMA